MKTTYWQNDKYIEEEGNKRTIEDYTYHFFPDFFKPTPVEYIAFLLCSPFSGSIAYTKYITSNYNIITTIMYGVAPTILIYGLYRSAETLHLLLKRLFKEGKSEKGKFSLDSFLESKKEFPYKPKITIETIDEVIEDTHRENSTNKKD